MRIAITGAYGFIGEHIVRACLAAGHEVVGFGRNLNVGRKRLTQIEWQHCDFNQDVDPALWAIRLHGCDALINCVGVLQSSWGNSASKVHDTGTIALFDGAVAAGVGKIIHLSALGAEEDVQTNYAATKMRADTYLASLDVEWVVLKPSLVYAQNCYGGTALLRGFAGLPGFIPLVEGGRHLFQPIAMTDLTRGIVALLAKPHLSRSVLIVTGPEQMSVASIVQTYRSWLGLRPAHIIPIPRIFAWPLLWAGDAISYFGRTTAFTSTSLRQMEKPNVGDGTAFARESGIEPSTMRAALSEMPSDVGDQLHAKTYWPLAMLRFMLVLFWIATGVITLLSSTSESVRLTDMIASYSPVFISSHLLAGSFAVIDITLGLWLLVARRMGLVCSVQIALSVGYIVAFSLLAPHLWLDPLGSILKTVPIVFATLLLAASQEER